MYDEFYSRAHELVSRGQPFVTVVVVRAERPTSARPGDKAIVTADSVMTGWIGGSCAQPTVIEQSLKALADGLPRLIRLSPNPEDQAPRDGLVDLPMTCFSGGTLEIYLEPQLPPPRLMIVGNLPIAQALARLARVMNYHVIVVDPETTGAGVPDADEVVTALDQMAGKITPLTYVVVTSHGRYDELALEVALRARPAYVALVASKARSAEVLDYLAAQGVAAEDLARLKYPAGLDIQAVRGDEIALSIMAEIVQKRHQAGPVDVSHLLAVPEAGAAEAIDPVCGMTVQIEGAAHVYTYEGETYYFCCEGCLKTFAADPGQYLSRPAPAGEAIDPVCGMTVAIATARYMSEYEGALFYFCAAGCKLAFDREPERYRVGTTD